MICKPWPLPDRWERHRDHNYKVPESHCSPTSQKCIWNPKPPTFQVNSLRVLQLQNFVKCSIYIIQGENVKLFCVVPWLNRSIKQCRSPNKDNKSVQVLHAGLILWRILQFCWVQVQVCTIFAISEPFQSVFSFAHLVQIIQEHLSHLIDWDGGIDGAVQATLANHVWQCPQVEWVRIGQQHSIYLRSMSAKRRRHSAANTPLSSCQTKSALAAQPYDASSICFIWAFGICLKHSQ